MARKHSRSAHIFRARDKPCEFKGCNARFINQSGLTKHIHTKHNMHPIANAPLVHPIPPVQVAQPSTPVSGPLADQPLGMLGSTPEVQSPEALAGRESTPPPPNHPSSAPSTPRTPRRGHHRQSPRMAPGAQAHGTTRGQYRITTHPDLSGKPCRANGEFLALNTPPPPPPPLRAVDDFSPFDSRSQFELADFLYRQSQMGNRKIDELMQLWNDTLPEDIPPPLAGHEHLHDLIDAIPLGDVPWQSFSIKYEGPLPSGEVPSWMEKEYDVWYRCPREVLQQQLRNSDLAKHMDYSPKRVFRNCKREYEDFMSGNWAWSQADILAKEDANYGATFCPVVLGSDKTTVLIATGQNEYYPLYLSNGLVHNPARHAHRNAVTLIAFLAIPKTERGHADSVEFRKFRRQLFHQSLENIMESLRPAMTTPEVTLCADGHYRRVIYGLGPYIADYPEQCLLACIVQGWCARCTAVPEDLDGSDSTRRSHKLTDVLITAYDGKLKPLWEDYGIVADVVPFTVVFPRADIHQMLSPDLLHQVIKGTFKDHIMAWVEDYIKGQYPKKEAEAILADIDRRIAAVPSFPGLRRFPEGRGFKQWTGDDSKALMKVYLPAITGHVPNAMVRAIAAFMEFCYLVRRDVFPDVDEDTLVKIDQALATFHREREIFQETGVRISGFSLPRQHSLKHYRYMIQMFGSPNGLCSSITESKHIKAVKEPWRRTNKYEALGQMLLINQRLDKLAAARVDFTARGMLFGSTHMMPSLSRFSRSSGGNMQASAASGSVNADDNDGDDGAIEGEPVMAEVTLARCYLRNYPTHPVELAMHLDLLQLPILIRRFLFEQLNPYSDASSVEVDIDDCPPIPNSIHIYPSAVSTYYSPSDPCGVGGMHRERIRAVSSWRSGAGRQDCIFVEKDPDLPGFRGLHVARVLLFFQFKCFGRTFPCALVTWFSPVSDMPDETTGMWVVEPDQDESGARIQGVIHLDSILRGAHLIGVAGAGFIPRELNFSESLDAFKRFYVNKFADHHSHEIAF
ncbi:hypothetical protein K474DRAFT_1686626 [Panus rudis PR-1116 ss-1]|nr:hypothetical protein K474DRAFT_1686626 [Panus rudis PR-1116 ss-1]